MSSFSKVLAQNSGYDPQETLVKVQTEHAESGQLTGVDLNTGKNFLNYWDDALVRNCFVSQLPEEQSCSECRKLPLFFIKPCAGALVGVLLLQPVLAC